MPLRVRWMYFFAIIELQTYAASQKLTPSCAKYYEDLFRESKARIDYYPQDSLPDATHFGHVKMQPIGVIRNSRHPRVREVIRALEAEGGEVVLAKTSGYSGSMGYFSYTLDDPVPRLVIDENLDLLTLEHEFTHFLDWKKLRDDLRAQGVESDKLMKQIWDARNSPSFDQHTETRAIAKEVGVLGMKAKNLQEPYSQTPEQNPIPFTPWDLDIFVFYMTYPETQALHSTLWQLKQPQADYPATHAVGEALKIAFTDKAIRKALLIRKTAFMRAKRQIQTATEKGDLARVRELQEFQKRQMNLGSLFEQICQHQLSRFQVEGTDWELRLLFRARIPVVTEELQKKHLGDFKPSF